MNDMEEKNRRSENNGSIRQSETCSEHSDSLDETNPDQDNSTNGGNDPEKSNDPNPSGFYTSGDDTNYDSSVPDNNLDDNGRKIGTTSSMNETDLSDQETILNHNESDWDCTPDKSNNYFQIRKKEESETSLFTGLGRGRARLEKKSK